MPLFKRTPFFLLDPPKDLDPKEKVFEVRFTKEIFRDYQEYLNRLNLYRRRVWTCKVSGKSNLTYEEALVSEQRAAEKAQQLPRELISPVLQMVQYSTLSLTDLVNKIYGRLQEDLFEGLELHAKKDGSDAACKILKVIGSGNTTSYEVGWIDQDNAVISTSVLRADDLIRKKAPSGRNMLKLFIRESTSQNSPWIVHASLAKKYGIPTEPPEDMMNGEGLSKTRKRLANGTLEDARKRLKKDEEQVVPVKYPIDDLLVKPTADDPVLSKRCPPSTDFKVPLYSAGDLLMVWDFCMSFGRLLCLSPFSLSDLENAVCHKESNVLIVEIHTALFHFLIKDEGDYFTIIQNKKRKSKISLLTWKEYLCDFMEMTSKDDFSPDLSTVRRGHYGLVDTGVKLQILRELVDEAIATTALKVKLEERIDQQLELVAAKREVARKNKEEQKLNLEGTTEKEMNHPDAVPDSKESVNGQLVAKEGKERENAPASKIDDGKLYLRRNLEKEMLDQSVRTSPLGKDRLYNRYWFFRREGRLFVESADSKEWGYYSTKEELDALIGSLNIKGIRERALKQQIEKFYDKIRSSEHHWSRRRMGGLRRWLPSCCCFDRGGSGGGAGRSGSVADDGLLWTVALKAHASGDYSLAVAQANQALEDQAQVLVSPASTLVGVYDGHGGPDAARFVNARLLSLIQEFANENGGLSADVIKKAFGATEDEFMDMVAKSWPTQPPGWCLWAPAAWWAPSRTARSTSPT